jgi:hypothetical protein
MNKNETDESRDALLVLSGVAMIAAGAGLIMSHPDARRYLKEAIGAFMPNMQEELGDGLMSLLPNMERFMGMGLSAALPDVERYVKLRNM